MIGPVSNYNPFSTYGAYTSRTSPAQDAQKAAQAQKAGQNQQRPDLMKIPQKAAQPETPVQPVNAAKPVSAQDPAKAAMVRFNADPAEPAVRSRIEDGDDAQKEGIQAANAEKDKKAQLPDLPGIKGDGSDEKVKDPALKQAKSAQDVMKESECQTCKNRKYQDGSDDPGVSFKTPTHISPDQAANAVRGHENEHVTREQAKAQREGRRVVSQSVSYHTGICPECGKTYVSGGTTRTVTKAAEDQQAQNQNQQDKQDPRAPIAAIA